MRPARCTRGFVWTTAAALGLTLVLPAGLGAPAQSAATTSIAATPPPEPIEPGAPGHVVLAGETTTSLDGVWAFRTDPERTGVDAGWTEPETDVTDWDRLPVPGNWDVHDRYAKYRGVAFYRRDFTAPRIADGRVARLRFGAVYERFIPAA